MIQSDDVLVFAHIGDLHLTTEDAQNYKDLLAIIDALDAIADDLAFVVLPGDNADDGLPEQYRLVASALGHLNVPVHVIAGDHDMPKAAGATASSLANFYRGLPRARPLPYAETVRGVRCLFLDMSGPGQGHLDFRIGTDQMRWLAEELETAADARCAVFMHTYPADITDPFEKAAMIRLLDKDAVRLVDIGHTHYNELANDGRKIYAATRSTGQIEEAKGVPGFSIATIDRNVVSWRFRTLHDPRPIVLVTAPSDRRLATRRDDPDHHGRSASRLRARVLWHRPIRRIRYGIDGACPIEIIGDDIRRIDEALDLTAARSVTVEATDAAGISGHETVDLARGADFAQVRAADGSDADRIDRWIERGILGSQLGPNRNGRGW